MAFFKIFIFFWVSLLVISDSIKGREMTPFCRLRWIWSDAHATGDCS